MDLLFAYPIILPSSGGGRLPIEVIWAMLIVFNALGVITFLCAIFINRFKNKNKGREFCKESLLDTIWDYLVLFLFIGLAIFADVIAVFCGLVLWVATLL